MRQAQRCKLNTIETNRLREKYKHLLGKQVNVHVYYKDVERKTLLDVVYDPQGCNEDKCWFVTADGKYSIIEEIE